MRKLLVAALLVLTLPATASAQLVHWRHSWHHRTRVVNTGQYVEADNNSCTAANVQPFMQAHSATVLRMVVTPQDTAAGQNVACIDQARADGYKIYLSALYDPMQTATQLQDYFRLIVATYGQPWAMSVGNEEPLNGQATATGYLATWATVEPTIKQIAPTTLLIAGEADPWHVSYDEQIAQAHPVGAAAISYHCYQMQNTEIGLDAVPALAKVVHHAGYPLWCSEMAPATAPTAPGFLAQTTPDAWSSLVTQKLRTAQMRSYYEWQQLGATTPGI